MFIIQNQDGYFLAKSGEWLDGREPGQLFKTLLKDEAVNQMFEANSRDYNLRLSLLECEINSKKQPHIPEDKLPPSLEESPDTSSDSETNPMELDPAETNTPQTETMDFNQDSLIEKNEAIVQ
jgi:hypothetical protein